jgi:hypothetical protein
MNKLIIILMLCLPTVVFADCYRNFTQEQKTTLHVAIAYTHNSGYRQTIAAIIAQESFVGDKIIKINFNDGKYGSFGITQINLETALVLQKIRGRNYAPAVEAEKLFNNFHAIDVAIMKLNSVHRGNWLQTWNRYNGNSKTYGYLIRDHIRELKKCGFFGSYE